MQVGTQVKARTHTHTHTSYVWECISQNDVQHTIFSSEILLFSVFRFFSFLCLCDCFAFVFFLVFPLYWHGILLLLLVLLLGGRVLWLLNDVIRDIHFSDSFFFLTCTSFLWTDAHTYSLAYFYLCLKSSMGSQYGAQIKLFFLLKSSEYKTNE